EDETVATDPLVVARIAPHHLLEEPVRGRCEAHRGTGMPVSYLLNRVGGEHTRCVPGLIVKRTPCTFGHVLLTPSQRTARRRITRCDTSIGWRCPQYRDSPARLPAGRRDARLGRVDSMR